jgi:hypothetical protein
MCVQALMADTLGSPFAFHNSEGVKRFDDCASFRLINFECNHTLSYCSLGGFNALRQDFGVRFKDGGFVELHPLVGVCIHCRPLSGLEKGIIDD